MKISGGYIFATIALVGSVAVAYTGNDGWGWLLFVAALVALNQD